MSAFRPEYVAVFALIASAAGACSTGPATSDGPAADLSLEFSGGSDWQVACNSVTTRGEAVSEAQGRSSQTFGVIVVRNMVSSSCTYETGSDPLTVRLEEDDLACPFGDYDDGVCTTVLDAGTSGALDFTANG